MRNKGLYLGILLMAMGAGVRAESRAVDSGAYAGWVEAALGAGVSGAGRFTVVGWSRDGKVALTEHRDPGEAAPMIFVRLRVIDAVEDTLLFDRTVSVDPTDPSVASTSSIAGLPDCLDFEAAMRNAAIEALPAPAGGEASRMRAFPFAYKDSVIDAAVESASAGQVEGEPSPRRSYSVWVRSSLKGRKKITDGVEQADSIEMLGYFASPYEARILTVFDLISRGFEGDPTRNPRFSGCYLESRFEKN